MDKGIEIKALSDWNIVERRNGERALVLGGYFLWDNGKILKIKDWMLKAKEDDLDIVRVYKGIFQEDAFFDDAIRIPGNIILWECEEHKIKKEEDIFS